MKRFHKRIALACLAALVAFLALPAFADPDPFQALLAETVAAATANGLNQGEANSLTTKLEAAVDSFSRGSFTATAGELGAFVNEVEAFERTGRLAPADAEQLIADAEQIASGLGGGPF